VTLTPKRANKLSGSGTISDKMSATWMQYTLDTTDYRQL